MFVFAHKKDIYIILIILVLSFIAFVMLQKKSKGTEYAEIIYNGVVVKEVPLNEETVFSVKEVPAVLFEVKENAIGFISSDCPDKVCVNEGYIKSGTAACLPNKLILRVVSGNAETDAIVYGGN